MYSSKNSSDLSINEKSKSLLNYVIGSPRDKSYPCITKKINLPHSTIRNDKTITLSEEILNKNDYLKCYTSPNTSVIGCMITNIDEKPYDKNILILPEGRKSIRYRQQPKFIGKRSFKRTSDDNFFLQICKFLINWDVIKEESKRNTPLTWSLIFMITLLFIIKCFTSQFRPLFNSQENEYIPPNNFTSPYIEVEIEKIKIIPSWYLSITSIDMVKTFALYYPLIKETNYVNEVLKYTRDREKNSQCCYDITNDIGYQTMVGVKCMGRENKRIIKNRHLYEGNICGIDPLYCHKNDKNDIILPLNVIDYPIDIICDYSKKSNIIHDETFIEIPYKPCTFGIHGRCELMSEDKCNWIGGYYHYEANLCSQVNGIEDLIFLGNDWHLFWLLNEKILAFLESYLSLFTRIVISLISVESFLSLLVVIFMILHGILILERQHSIEVVITLYIFYSKIIGLSNLIIQPNIPHYSCFNIILSLFSLSNIYPKIINGSERIYKNRLYYLFLLSFTFFVNPSTPIITPWANIISFTITIIQRKFLSYPSKEISLRKHNIIMITSLILFLLPLEWIIIPFSNDIIQDFYCDFFPDTDNCIYYNNLRAVNFNFFKKVSFL